MFVPFGYTEENFERQFGVNHLGHFALTGLLLDRLVSTSGDRRVVTVSSGYHRRSDRTEFETVHNRPTYDKGDAYSDSKLANVLFAQELQRRLLEADHDVKSVACHPGWAATNLQSRGPREEGSRLKLLATRVANRVFAQSATRGAWPTVYAATSPAVHGGEYVGPGGFMNMRGTPEIQTASDRANDPDVARRLWEHSEEWTDIEFGLPVQGTSAAESDAEDTGVGGTAD
jgi:Dehydrogenases with different specificities (related to short-chain alcohol dehydrogenases)